MASEGFEYRQGGELPPAPIDLYRARIHDEGTNDVDALWALETLIADNLAINQDAAAELLVRMNFPELIRQLRDSDYEEQSRIVAEVFAMAPLLHMWPSIRDLWALQKAKEWLVDAVDLALSEVEGHESCTTDEFDDVDCPISPFCPKKTVAKALAHQAVQPPNDFELMLGNPLYNLMTVRRQLEVGVDKGLFSLEKASELTEEFSRQRPILKTSE